MSKVHELLVMRRNCRDTFEFPTDIAGPKKATFPTTGNSNSSCTEYAIFDVFAVHNSRRYGKLTSIGRAKHHKKSRCCSELYCFISTFTSET